jgi:hypothetical protein
MCLFVFIIKVSLSFLPMHCQFIARAPMCNEISISKRAAKVEFHDILVSSAEGDMGLVCRPVDSSLPSSGNAPLNVSLAQMPATFHRIASSPPVSISSDSKHRPVIACCVVPEAKVLASVARGGALLLTHSETGVMVCELTD